MAARRSAPAMNKGWEDVFEQGMDLDKHDSPSMQRRRRSPGVSPRRAGHPVEHNPFEQDFLRAANTDGVRTRPCRSAVPQSAPSQAKATKKAEQASETKEQSGLYATWIECRDFLARVVALVVEDYLAVALKSQFAKRAKGYAASYAARAGAGFGTAAGAAAGGPAGAAVG